jgi:hypothetical protein
LANIKPRQADVPFPQETENRFLVSQEVVLEEWGERIGTWMPDAFQLELMRRYPTMKPVWIPSQVKMKSNYMSESRRYIPLNGSLIEAFNKARKRRLERMLRGL